MRLLDWEPDIAKEISARHVTVEENGDTLTIGFADDAINPTSYLLLQRTLKASEQDKKLGLDKIYVECDDQLHSAYGGVKEVSLYPSKIVVSFSDRFPNALGGERNITVEFGESRFDFDTLRSALEKVVSDEVPLRTHA